MRGKGKVGSWGRTNGEKIVEGERKERWEEGKMKKKTKGGGWKQSKKNE